MSERDETDREAWTAVQSGKPLITRLWERAEQAEKRAEEAERQRDDNFERAEATLERLIQVERRERELREALKSGARYARTTGTDERTQHIIVFEETEGWKIVAAVLAFTDSGASEGAEQ